MSIFGHTTWDPRRNGNAAAPSGWLAITALGVENAAPTPLGRKCPVIPIGHGRTIRARREGTIPPALSRRPYGGDAA